MLERTQRAARQVIGWLISLFEFIARPFRALWRGVTAVGRWLRAHFGPPLYRFWKYLGRVGIVLRKIVTVFVWEPLLLFSPPFVIVWRLIGRFGLAIRALLTLFIWRPVAWVWRRLIYPLLSRIGRLFWRFITWWAVLLSRWRIWAWGKLSAFATSRWQATAYRRSLLRRYGRSRWLVWQARWHVYWRKPQPPSGAIIAPRRPNLIPANVRIMRFAGLLASATLIVLLTYTVWQRKQLGQPILSLPSVVIYSATATPLPPTATPRPTATPLPQLTPWPTPDPFTAGGSVAFTLKTGGQTDLYMLSVGSAEPIRLTYDPADDREPAWSPNGRQLAFSSHRNGSWDIYIYDLPQGILRRITSGLAYEGHPAWSPDGQWLVYESYFDNNMDLYILRTDLTEGPFQITHDPALDYHPTWGPDGRHIAFTSLRSGNPDIWIMSLDEVFDSSAINLTASPALAEDEATFNPDGRTLAYTESSSKSPVIYTMTLNEALNHASPPQAVGGQGHYPTWLSDGEALLYVYQHNGRSYLVGDPVATWGILPQAYSSDGVISDPTWTGVSLPPDVLTNFQPVDTPVTDLPLYVEALVPPNEQAPDPPISLFKLVVDAPSPYLSDRVDQSFLALRERVMAEAGWDYLGKLDNLFVALASRPQPDESRENWNQAGRAFDVPYQDPLAFEPQIEVVREDVDTQTFWHVYLKTAVQDGSQGEPLRQLPWDFRARFGDEPQYYDQGGKLKEAIPPGYYVDFTALAADYGWERVPAGKAWRTFFPSIRFWHFENRQGLVWWEAMREVYTEADLTAVGLQP